MLHRCQYVKDESYKYYGGRGISVCERWHKFENFYEDMGEKPNGLALERIDSDGDYEPGNCKWATHKEQANNKRPISCGPQKQYGFTAFGPNDEQIISNNQREFARKYGLNNSHISACLRKVLHRKSVKGWTFQRLE